MNKSVTVKAHPSLALIKYWGKADREENLPATSSLALNLSALSTETEVSFAEEDQVFIDGVRAPEERYAKYFVRLRQVLNTDRHFLVKSCNHFPTAAGIASSSSGFAALTLGCMALVRGKEDRILASDLARFGSASAARCLFDGLTVLPKNAKTAEELFPPDHWPELRVIVAIVKKEAKETSSRTAMERARLSSPFYHQWLETSEELFQRAVQACRQKNLLQLGEAMQKSYLSMFATMWTSTPPVMYWEPQSLAVIKFCQEMRNGGMQVWETMDAGPQVKMLCLESDLATIRQKLEEKFPDITFLCSQPGLGASVLSREFYS